jgi:hypothetical protein
MHRILSRCIANPMNLKKPKRTTFCAKVCQIMALEDYHVYDKVLLFLFFWGGAIYANDKVL